MTTLFRTLFGAILLLVTTLPSSAQLSVTLEIKRRLYIRYEPILATVKVTNLSGRDMMLQDGEQPWFGFDVTGVNTETLIPPRELDYHLDPLEIKIGETVKRTVNLTKLYGISEFGVHRIKATIFARDLNKLFASKIDVVEITEGRNVWTQVVGVPDSLPNAGRNHTVKLLEFQDDKRYLYARVEDVEKGEVLCMYRIGHMIDGTTPQMQFDTANNLYILHLIGPKTYALTNVGINGEFLGQYVYNAPKSRPSLRRLADGTVQIVGGLRQTANVASSENPPPSKLSDRPPGLPAN